MAQNTTSVFAYPPGIKPIALQRTLSALSQRANSLHIPSSFIGPIDTMQLTLPDKGDVFASSLQQPWPQIHQSSQTVKTSSPESSSSSDMDIALSSETQNDKPVPTFMEPPPLHAVQESFSGLFGPDVPGIKLRQGTLGDCYLVAVFDALIHHRVGEKMLRKIKIETLRDDQDRVKHYRITFPSNRLGGNTVEFPASEFGPERYKYKLLHGPAGLRILELAYLKLVRGARNKLREDSFPEDGFCHTPQITDGGHSHDVLVDMFGGESLYVTPRLYAKTDRVITPTDTLNASPDAVQEVLNMLWHTVASKNNHYFLCAKTPEAASPDGHKIYLRRGLGEAASILTFKTSHTYSIRGYDPDNKTVTVANPHDTAHDVTVLTRDEFCQVFRSVSGLRIPKNTLASSL